MYQPGMDQGLAQIRYKQVLEAAANERADQGTLAAAPKPQDQASQETPSE